MAGVAYCRTVASPGEDLRRGLLLPGIQPVRFTLPFNSKSWHTMNCSAHTLVALWIACVSPAFSQRADTIRFCTYNLLNYGASVDPARILSFQDVLGSINPHVLLVQEIHGNDGMAAFARDALATTPYLAAAPFTDGPDSDNGLFYDSTKITVIEHAVIPTPLRHVDRWRLRLLATNDTVDVWGLHLKAGDSDSDRVKRGIEAGLVRASLDSSQAYHRVVGGDLNVYNQSEEAYTMLTYTGFRPAGEVMDPIARSGNWHNNQEFADVHTQSTRARPFGGGATGGMDDRFDWLLCSPSLLARYREGSYNAFGNDGKHLDDSINALPNNSVGLDIAQSLHEASDHLPVYMDVIFTGAASGVRERPAHPHTLDLSEQAEGTKQ